MSSEARSNDGSATALFALLASIALALYAYQCQLYAHYTNDDAYITFRYSRFLALGRGPYFNPGEHVEGYTNLLLMLITAPVIALAGPHAAPLAAKALGAASGALALLVALGTARKLALLAGVSRWRASLVGATALGMIAAAPAYALNAMSGLETLLFAACVTIGVALGLRETLECRWLGSGIAFALAALTRPEGVFLFAAFWAACVIGQLFTGGGLDMRSAAVRLRLRALLINAAAVVAVVGVQLTFRRLAYDGEWLPNTYYAKQGGFSKVPAAVYVAQALGGSVFGWFGLAVGALGLCFARLPRRVLLPLLAFNAAGLSLPMLAGSDWMLGSRLLVPYMPVLAVGVVLGWDALLSRLSRRAITAGVLVALVPLSWQLHAGQRAELARHIELRALGYESGHRALGQHISAHARPGDAIALMDIGIVGYEAIDQTIVDITGLTDRSIAKSAGGFLEKQYDFRLVLDREPRFIVLVLTAPGRSYEPPPPSTRFAFWTNIETTLFQDPRFQAHYVQSRALVPGADWLERLAVSTGATRAFPHAHPGSYYVLALFERHS